VELGLNGRWGDGWLLDLAWTTQRNEARDGSVQPFSPRHTGKWALQIPLAPALKLSFDGLVTSTRSGRQTLPGYAQTQGQLLWQPSRQWDFYIGAQNLGGRSYAEASAGPLSDPLQHRGERWHAGLTWRGVGL
jgi:outer membrane receptor protein involved in Fe transport